MAAARMVWDGATMAADKMRAVEGLRVRVGGSCAAEGCGLRLRGTRGMGWVFIAWVFLVAMSTRGQEGTYRRQEATIRPGGGACGESQRRAVARRCSVRVSAAWHEVGRRASMGPAHLAWMWVGSRSAQMK